MKKFALLLTLLLTLTLSGCAGEEAKEEQPSQSAPPAEEIPVSKRDAIPFEDGQIYAVAHLGYQKIENLSPYLEKYLDEEPPVHYVSDGDYYLIIPRYDNMDLALYHNSIDMMENGDGAEQSDLFYEEKNCRPFIVQCNVSDIFPDVTILFGCEEGGEEFSPYISLKDGSVEIGEKGLLLD